MNYSINPACYAKNMMAIQCPSDDGWKTPAAIILEQIAGKSIRYSNREQAYIVSKLVAERFERAMRRKESESR